MQSNSTPPLAPQPRRSSPKNGFTPRQTALLILFCLFGVAVIGATAFFLFSGAPTGPSAAAVEPPSPTASMLPPQSTATEQAPTIAIPADCAKSGSNAQEGQARVIDGQTLEVTVKGTPFPVRFAALAFPKDSSASASFLESKVAGQMVTVVKDVTDRDSDGKLVRYVFAGGQFINDELVRQGFARADYNTSDRSCIIPLQLSEQQARIDRLGIWQATPVPTATFMPIVTLDTSQQSCDCSKKYTCSDFQTHDAAQTCFNACNDYSSKLDEDHNGIACENLP